MKQKKSYSLDRRSFVGGALAAGAVSSVAAVGGIPALANASIAPVLEHNLKSGGMSLVEHLCTVSHSYLNEKLNKMVADPSISSEKTAMALRSTHCPYCNTMISASYPVTPLIEVA